MEWSGLLPATGIEWVTVRHIDAICRCDRPQTFFSSNFNLSKQELCGFVDNIHWIYSGPSKTNKLTIPETLNGQRTQPTNIKVGGGEREREKMNNIVVSAVSTMSTPASRLPKQLWALFLFLTERKIISQTSDKPHGSGKTLLLQNSTRNGVPVQWNQIIEVQCSEALHPVIVEQMTGMIRLN